MPGMSGYEVCRRIRADAANGILPVVMVTALDPAAERIKGLEAGADDFLTKPINLPELLARVRSLLRIKQLYDTVEAQSAQLAELNRTLEQRVADQVGQLERLVAAQALLLAAARRADRVRAAPTTRSGPTGARSRSSSSTCAASRPSPRRPSRRR